jgi:hypothetical protein
MVEGMTGQCVCGEVSFEVIGEPKRITICHCKWCQRRTGSAFGVEVVFDASDVVINDEAVSWYRHHSDESGRWLDQHFCAKCGSNIGFTLEAVPGIRTIAAGTFDEQSWLNSDKYTQRHVFTRSAQHWSDIPEGVESYKEHFR